VTQEKSLMNGAKDVQKEAAYWMMLAHMPHRNPLWKNRLAVSVLLTHGMKFSEFFALPEDRLSEFNLTSEECRDVVRSRDLLPEYLLVLSELQAANVALLPLHSPLYSRVLKDNLKMPGAPFLFYAQGDTALLQMDAAAVVGARDARPEALNFAENIARKAAEDGCAVVSGMARGTDKKALDAVLSAGGKSIAVLPQGILTAQSSLRFYRRFIERGDLLVLSSFYPKNGWSVGQAMARNAVIYGLARDIYVAETGESGGTWSGANDALKRGRAVHIYYSENMRSRALSELIRRGAVPVGADGNESEASDL
jgi:predicted Rossmann fold nucleotide-binding protein DprA/Smf involved in DNA uptake